jgi:hypothetical protein
MPFDLSLPLFAAFGLALGGLVTYFGWPRIHLRTYHKTHGDLRVVELALILSRPARSRQPSGGKEEPERHPTEFVIYMTLKTGNL